ncbi:hypothetical protein SLEP1_g10871 [Rubroshorea leprosula]|uniref:Uncharacterized protein n=1 Tax=Rubroshorea leprosula TaxID=152421 RepID=A0AAV5IKB6_9ROSI|nr:hypothetical protein SLEP1_g10871 [Rubroshorea leprosula]
MIKNILFNASLANMDSLKSLVRDDSVRQILRILKNEGEVHLYVDHELNFAYVIDPVLSISWKDVVVNGGGGVGVVNNNNNEGPFEADIGNVTIERQGLNEDNFDNSPKEFDSEYESQSDEDLGSLARTDDEEYLIHLHRARPLRKKRRARSGVEKKVQTPILKLQGVLMMEPSVGEATLVTEQPSMGGAIPTTEQLHIDATTLAIEPRPKGDERDNHYEDNNDPCNLWTSSSDVDEDEYHRIEEMRLNAFECCVQWDGEHAFQVVASGRKRKNNLGNQSKRQTKRSKYVAPGQSSNKGKQKA